MDDVLARPRPRARVPVTNIALFVATLATTIWAGMLFSPAAAGVQTFGELFQLVGRAPDVLLEGLPFALSLVGILFVHEMGHYVLARRARVDTTLPYFIPVPFGVGTLGAVIRMRSAIPSRRAILDIGASGPLAGLALALPLLAVGARALADPGGPRGDLAQLAVRRLHGLARRKAHAGPTRAR